jgi:hypothetical protein
MKRHLHSHSVVLEPNVGQDMNVTEMMMQSLGESLFSRLLDCAAIEALYKASRQQMANVTKEV